MSASPERSKKIQRQYKRYLGRQDVEDVLLGAISQAPSDGGQPDFIEIIQKFPDFISAIESAYVEYEDRINIASRNIEISSHELTKALDEVEKLNLNINAMLDSLGQGLLFFNNEGVCSDVYSRSCLPLLGKSPANLNLAEVLDFSADTRETFGVWLSVVFSGNSAMDFHDLKKLMPQEIINYSGQIIELDYRPMYLYGNALSGILLIATDVTYQRAAEIRFKALQVETQKIQQIAMDRNGFHSLVTDLYSLVSMMQAYPAGIIQGTDYATLKRALHTFKGQAGMYSLDELGEQIHAIETDMRNLYTQGIPSAELIPYADALKILIDQAREYAQRLFGPDFMAKGRTKIVNSMILSQLRQIVGGLDVKTGSGAELQKFIFENFLAVRIFDLFYSFKREIARLCELNGKEEPVFHMSGSDALIVPEDYADFFKVLVHVARNISDHAIEAPDIRLEKGKSPQAHVTIDVRLEAGRDLQITISDDGKGINPADIRNRLAQKTGNDHAHEPDDQVIYHVFDTELSAKSGATMISGRGIGMGAVYEAVQGMGGSITLKSDYAQSKGTSIGFILPYRSGA